MQAEAPPNRDKACSPTLRVRLRRRQCLRHLTIDAGPIGDLKARRTSDRSRLAASLPSPILCVQPMEIYVDDEAKLTLHGLVQHYVVRAAGWRAAGEWLAGGWVVRLACRRCGGVSLVGQVQEHVCYGHQHITTRSRVTCNYAPAVASACYRQMLNEDQKNRKLNDLLDALDFNQVGWLI